MINEYEDGFELKGNVTNEQVMFESFGDHRIAMAFGVFSMLMKNGSSVNEFECVGISNPNFVEQINHLITSP